MSAGMSTDIILVVRNMEAQAAVGCAVVAFLAVLVGGILAGRTYHSGAGAAAPLQIAAYTAGAVLLVLLAVTMGTTGSVLSSTAKDPPALVLDNGAVTAVQVPATLISGGLGVACAALVPAVAMAAVVAAAAYSAPPQDTKVQTASWITLGACTLAMLLLAPSVGLFATLNNQLP